ncbi:HaeIII family restriction endonuclease [Mycoplasma sp. Ms02]|uniref:HaeIII family restriction endonuclease n=1 Tax=Mycoplasma sp. Ms02 TaxID=353851 RepID=UPI001C899FD6|nr:HaeIII family restriction endonuclease [Mycoplasma sp. Ms02]QZE12220.1 HaeIII family restriction endonuclease [Mycoplasma sp. Ms02]
MSIKSNINGRAFEYIYLTVLHKEIQKLRSCVIVENKQYFSAQKSWNLLKESDQDVYKLSVLSTLKTLFELEPKILEKVDGVLSLEIQEDKRGERGDVRDIIINTRDIKWEIGLSLKHNHFAAKHSRISKELDFSKKWYQIPCSEEYKNEVKPIFSLLDSLKQENLKWNEIPRKAEIIYFPLLNAFKKEIFRQNGRPENKIPSKLTEYILGKYDFYKIISIDQKRITQVQAFNFKGALNQGVNKNFVSRMSKTCLPSRIVSFDIKPKSKTTLEMYLDNGWQFNFRIHSASSKVQPSLKFDIGIIGMPATILTINCEWKK